MANPIDSIDIELAEVSLRIAELMNRRAALENAKRLLQEVYKPLNPIPSIEQFMEAADVGITDAVRGAFRLHVMQELTATDVRNIVASHGFDLSKYRNAMATIHQVISRLVEGKEITPRIDGNMKLYRWAGPTSIGTLMQQLSTPPDITSSTFAKLGEALREQAEARKKLGEAFMKGPNYIKGPEKKK